MVVRRRSSSARMHLLLVCLCFCMLGTRAADGKLPEEEIQALKEINQKLSVGWDFTVNPCSGKKGWSNESTTFINDIQSNLTCGHCDINNTCHVISLKIKTQNLTGNLPVEIANLKSLRVLDLTRNYIGGSIPPEWSSLPLVKLSLGNNRITGAIPPEFGDMSSLESLVLENNLLNGSIPAELGRLTSLSRLIISSNDFTGQIPDSLGNLTNLTDFRIDGSSISGKIPSFIGNWRKLLRLHMHGTSLEGPFPPVFPSLPNLIDLQASDLKGVQSFPPNITLEMKHIVLRNCSISGELPKYVGGMNRLGTLDLSFNNFTGEIPSSYRQLRRMEKMYLSNNRLTGKIPQWIRRVNHVIDLSFNYFQADPSLTVCMPQGSQLNMFASCSSSKDTKIPPCFRKNYPCPGKVKNYKLFINCGGPNINVGGNLYEKDEITNGASTSYTSPNEKWAFTSTGNFYNNNKLAKYIATNRTVLKTSNPELYMTARLNPSSLRYYGICLINGNYTVNLHFAEIIFIDNKTLYSVGRRFFDVFIQGKLVLEDFNIAVEANGTGRAIKMNFSEVSVRDNTLEIEFRWSGKGTNSVPEKGVYGPLVSAISITPEFTPPKEGPKERELNTGAILGIAATACAVFLLVALTIWCLVKRRQRNANELIDMEMQTRRFTLRQIKSATGNFDISNKIGEGGFGPVYKGAMSDGTLIAVKQLSSKSRQGNQEFLNEVGLISTLQHPNLVKLLGCCIEGNQLLLVYEYMERNSLGHVLFDDNNKSSKLDWKTRRNICLGLARGIAYLHNSRFRVVHRDIKATNVLLDKDLNPKLSDFGLAKLYNQEHTHISTRVAGTTGYMAPEYATKGQLTVKADVYSFGIVMLEVVSGKGCVIRTPDKDTIYLLDLANELEESGRILELIDENLRGDYSSEEAMQLIKLALLCANSCPSNRPTMTRVVSVMESKTFVNIPTVRPMMTKSEEEKLKAFEECLDGGLDVSDSYAGPSDYSATTSTLNPSITHFTHSYHCEELPR